MTTSASELDWSETRQWIGRNLLTEPRHGVDPVERSTIRRELEVLEMDCPLHYDDEVARRHGYPGIIAPLHMVQVYQVSAIWEPGDPSRWTSDDPHFAVSGTGIPRGNELRVPTPGSAGFVTDLEVEFFQPLHLGDRVIQTENRLVEVNPRKTRVGDGAFLTYDSFYENQRHERVSRTRMVIYSYVPTPPPAAPAGRAPEAPRATPLPRPAPRPPVDWSRQRYWEDVRDGDEVPEVLFPLTIQREVMAAGANRDFNAIHHSTVAAQRGGAPDAYAMNFFHHGMWERTVREFIGLDGTFRKVGPFRMRIFATVGDTVVVRGKVAKKYQEGGQNLVELEMQSLSANSGNVTVGPGPVLVTLPLRAGAARAR